MRFFNRSLVAGILLGLILASFAPRLSGLTRMGFDGARNVAGASVQYAGSFVRP